jgi:hypothetical protein
MKLEVERAKTGDVGHLRCFVHFVYDGTELAQFALSRPLHCTSNGKLSIRAGMP